MIISILSIVVLPIEIGGAVVGGIIVLAFVWEKIRPVLIIKTDKGSKIYVGVSLSKKRKNMKSLSQEGIYGIEVDKDTSYGLANKPSRIIKEVGTVSVKKAQEIIDNIDSKKIDKIEKRTKTDD